MPDISNSNDKGNSLIILAHEFKRIVFTINRAKIY